MSTKDDYTGGHWHLFKANAGRKPRATWYPNDDCLVCEEDVVWWSYLRPESWWETQVRKYVIDEKVKF